MLNPTWDTPRKCKTTEPLRLWSPPLERTFPASKAIHDTTRTPASPQASWSYTHLSRVWAETLPWKQQRNVDMSMSHTGKPSQNADQIYIRTCRNIMKYPLLATEFDQIPLDGTTGSPVWTNQAAEASARGLNRPRLGHDVSMPWPLGPSNHGNGKSTMNINKNPSTFLGSLWGCLGYNLL